MYFVWLVMLVCSSRSFECEKKNLHQNCNFCIESHVKGNWWCLTYGEPAYPVVHKLLLKLTVRWMSKFLCIKTTTVVIKALIIAWIRHHCESPKVVERVRLVDKPGIKLRIHHLYTNPVIGIEVEYTTNVG